jgi:hypothetical protein
LLTERPNAEQPHWIRTQRRTLLLHEVGRFLHPPAEIHGAADNDRVVGGHVFGVSDRRNVGWQAALVKPRRDPLGHSLGEWCLLANAIRTRIVISPLLKGGHHGQRFESRRTAVSDRQRPARRRLAQRRPTPQRTKARRTRGRLPLVLGRKARHASEAVPEPLSPSKTRGPCEGQRAKTADDDLTPEKRRATTTQDARNNYVECYRTRGKEVVLESADLASTSALFVIRSLHYW